MALINTNSQAKQYVKVLFTNNETAIPNMTKAERRFIVPILGNDLYDELLTHVEESGTDADLETLLDKVRQALAPLAYWIDLPTIQSQITDAGIRTISNDNMQAAHRWEYEEIKAGLEEDGCWGLEYLLAFLFANASTYSWEPASEYDLIFKHAQEFQKYYPLYQPYRTFQSLRPVIKQIIDQYIISEIGQAFYEELIAEASPSAEQAAAIELIKQAVANLTVMRAVAVLSVKFGADGFTVTLGANTEKPDQGRQHANDNQLSLLLKECQRTGESYLLRLSDYLDATASASIFQTYFASEKYKDPNAVVTDPNSLRKGIFGM